MVESPYKGNNNWKTVERNLAYARMCMSDCIKRGEKPYASHLLLTQSGVTNDMDSVQRELGMRVGLAWAECAKKTVVYTDLGISDGMRHGIRDADLFERAVEMRTLDVTAAEIDVALALEQF